MMHPRIVIIFGTRPEVIKLAPIIKEFEKNYSNNIKLTLVNVAQHREMVDQLLNIFSISPDIDLNLMKKKQSLDYITSEALTRLSNLFRRVSPDYILVQGDTTTAMAASLAAFYNKISVGHVEAGLRTNDKYSPFPEEINRRIIGVVATHHFAPTKRAYNNLINEGVNRNQIFVTGNTVIDALLQIVESYKIDLSWGKNDKKLILLTAHRRENWGEKLESICRAVKKIVKMYRNVEIVYPVHLNPVVRESVYKTLGNTERIHLIEPVDYVKLITLMAGSYLIMTDSGGIQEEASVLGKPVLVLRDTTERPEGIEAGVSVLVGTDENRIFEVASDFIEDEKLYRKYAVQRFIYGDGKASERIAKIVYKFLTKKWPKA